MDEGGNTKDDLGLPKGTDDAEKLADQIKQDFDDGKELVVTVVKVCAAASKHLMMQHVCSVYTASRLCSLLNLCLLSLCFAGHGRGNGLCCQDCCWFHLSDRQSH